ncbi:GNAT family N-acetyltransferase [Uliginosibacterium sp. H1]|uniref:GNAT family N-acetyltransferase n=1 Tax=Uliginosibacterium sp. H1 TaxID=3114757 RepID=UPI002E17A473|nr:GNAT family N-acetyltransferase [Uliginosibacterium sp. H1]
MNPLQLVVPARPFLESYRDALLRGWSPNNLRPQTAVEELALIAADADSFLHSLDDRDPVGQTVTLPDGSRVPKLPGFRRWMWDGGFCGSIGLRWQAGTAELPAYCLGHIGYAVVPWKQRCGYATRALALLLDEARTLSLPYVELTTEPDNTGSLKVIEAQGGELVEGFDAPAQYEAGQMLRYRITLG